MDTGITIDFSSQLDIIPYVVCIETLGSRFLKNHVYHVHKSGSCVDEQHFFIYFKKDSLNGTNTSHSSKFFKFPDSDLAIKVYKHFGEPKDITQYMIEDGYVMNNGFRYSANYGEKELPDRLNWDKKLWPESFPETIPVSKPDSHMDMMDAMRVSMSRLMGVPMGLLKASSNRSESFRQNRMKDTIGLFEKGKIRVSDMSIKNAIGDDFIGVKLPIGWSSKVKRDDWLECVVTGNQRDKGNGWEEGRAFQVEKIDSFWDGKRSHHIFFGKDEDKGVYYAHCRPLKCSGLSKHFDDVLTKTLSNNVTKMYADSLGEEPVEKDRGILELSRKPKRNRKRRVKPEYFSPIKIIGKGKRKRKKSKRK